MDRAAYPIFRRRTEWEGRFSSKAATSLCSEKQHALSDTAAAMSEENVELVRRMIDAWNRGDITGWAGALHNEVEWFPLAENPQTQPIHGVGAMLEFVADWVKPWDELRIEVIRIVDAGDWVVVAGQHPRNMSRAPKSAWRTTPPVRSETGRSLNSDGS